MKNISNSISLTDKQKCCDTISLSSTGHAEAVSDNYNKTVLGVYVRCKDCNVPFVYKQLGGPYYLHMDPNKYGWRVSICY